MAGQTPSGATSNRHAIRSTPVFRAERPLERAGRWLEPPGDRRPRGMTVTPATADRIRPTDPLHCFRPPPPARHRPPKPASGCHAARHDNFAVRRRPCTSLVRIHFECCRYVREIGRRSPPLPEICHLSPCPDRKFTGRRFDGPSFLQYSPTSWENVGICGALWDKEACRRQIDVRFKEFATIRPLLT